MMNEKKTLTYLNRVYYDDFFLITFCSETVSYFFGYNLSVMQRWLVVHAWFPADMVALFEMD